MMYSSRMPVSEVIHLHYDDISRTNMQISCPGYKELNRSLYTPFQVVPGYPYTILVCKRRTLRNRCCPMFQAVPKEMWMDACKEDVLDSPYFHLVLTLPDILNPVIYSNQKLLYETLYHGTSATIRELATNPKHLGSTVGYIYILHTWSSEMNFHPHIHTILLDSFYNTKRVPYCK